MHGTIMIIYYSQNNHLSRKLRTSNREHAATIESSNAQASALEGSIRLHKASGKRILLGCMTTKMQILYGIRKRNELSPIAKWASCPARIIDSSVHSLSDA